MIDPEEARRKNAIVSAYKRITGYDSIDKEYCRGVYEILKTLPSEVFNAVIDTAPTAYDGNTAVPKPKFWQELRSDKMKSYQTFQPYVPKYKKPDENEKEYLKREAGKIAEHFASMCPSKKVKGKSAYHLKVERFKERARAGMVMVESLNHALEGQWISKDEAQGLIYTDPAVWLRQKGIQGF